MQQNIRAYRTKDPVEILGLIQEAEKISLPEDLYSIGADIVDTVNANTPGRDRAGAVAACLLRVAYVLNQEGRLIEKKPL